MEHTITAIFALLLVIIGWAIYRVLEFLGVPPSNLLNVVLLIEFIVLPLLYMVAIFFIGKRKNKDIN